MHIKKPTTFSNNLNEKPTAYVLPMDSDSNPNAADNYATPNCPKPHTFKFISDVVSERMEISRRSSSVSSVNEGHDDDDEFIVFDANAGKP
jgi:hypothetical protein